MSVNILDPGIQLSKVTSAHLGKVIAANGMVYDTKTIADYYSEGVAMVSYISSTGHGYGLSLFDTTPSPWSTAGTTVASYSKPHPDGTSWALPTLAQWNNMFAQFGGSAVGTDYACAKPYYSGTIRTKMTECGGQNLEGSYWSATEYNSTIAHDYTFELNYWCGANKTGACSIRPFFIF